jgi:hypothetical protein
MKRLCAVVGFYLASAACAMAADDWIGLDDEPSILIGFEFGEDEAEDSTRALSLDFPIGGSAGIYGYYSETELSDLEQEFDSLVLATTVWYQLSQLVDIELQHFFEGDYGELEKETLGLTLGLSQGGWNFRLQIEEGDTIFFTRAVDRDLGDTTIPDRFDSEVSGIGISLGRQIGAWYWQAGYQRYDYERDLTLFERSLVLQFIVTSSALAQTSLLISQQASLLLGHADLDNDYSILLYQDRSAIDESYEETLMLSWQHWASQRFGYLLAASMPLPAEDRLGLTLGLRWAL